MGQYDTLDIMLDLETMGQSTFPVLAQLSAVCFKVNEGKPLDSFNKFVSPQSCVAVGLSCRGNDDKGNTTMDWWLTQDKEVFNKVIIKALQEGEEISSVLKAFSAWIEEMKKKHNCGQVKVWGNGPAADCVWVRSAYLACNIPAPWKYWDDACVRTVLYQAQSKHKFFAKKQIPFEGEKHNAIDDCHYQIKLVHACWTK